uniref:RING-type domain-containing protein n=1 Tax=Caenorhabditis tropicalis TaxID=1561998 RepID=A0A1I7TPE1_9PELO
MSVPAEDPKVLPQCGHTVCENCLFTKAKTNEHLVREHNHRIYDCIECNAKIQLPCERKNDEGKPPKNKSILPYIYK